MSANVVLDVGCGTGALLHRARESGHAGRLCGLDPAFGMLEQARRRNDIEWIRGDLGSVAWEREFDLVVMTGHAFQVFVEDDELRRSLAASVPPSPVAAASRSRPVTRSFENGSVGRRTTRPRRPTPKAQSCGWRTRSRPP